MARRHATAEEETEINITPMLDIVFIMLIFFIVTTSFIKDPGLEVNRPEADTAISKQLGNILIAISDTGQIWMDKKRVELPGVRGEVERARLESPESSVIVIADKDAPTGAVIDVMDQIRMAGVKSMAVAAQPGN